MRHKLFLVFSFALAVLCTFQVPSTAKQSASKTYVHPQAGFTFQYPASAKCTAGNGEINGSTTDSVTVRWKGGFLAVKLMKMPLKKAIEESGALAFDEHKKYYRPGRFDTKGAVKSVKFGALSGLYGVSMCGVSDDSGFHAAGGSCLSGYLTDGKQTAYFESDGIFPTDVITNKVFPSFRFRK